MSKQKPHTHTHTRAPHPPLDFCYLDYLPSGFFIDRYFTYLQNIYENSAGQQKYPNNKKKIFWLKKENCQHAFLLCCSFTLSYVLLCVIHLISTFMCMLSTKIQQLTYLTFHLSDLSASMSFPERHSFYKCVEIFKRQKIRKRQMIIDNNN